MNEKEILEYAKNKGYNFIEYVGEWNGYQVYDLIIDKEEISYVGYPLVALIKDNQIRISTPEEALQVIDYFYSDDDEDE